MSFLEQRLGMKKEKPDLIKNNTHKTQMSNGAQANEIPESTAVKNVTKRTEEKDTYSATSVSTAFASIPVSEEIPIDKIDFDKHGYRCNVNSKANKQLIESIKKNGLLQPICVIRYKDRFKLIFGNRRIASCKLIGLKTIHARVYPAESITDAFPITENIKRSDYDPILFANEISKRIRSLKPDLDLDGMVKLFNNTDRQLKQHGKTDATVTSVLEETECSASTIRNHLNLLKLPAQIQKAIEENKMKPTLGYVLANNIKHQDYDAYCKKVLEEKMLKSTLEDLFESSVPPQTGTDHNSATVLKVLNKMIDLKKELKKGSDDLSYDDANKILSEFMLIKEIIEVLMPTTELDKVPNGE